MPGPVSESYEGPSDRCVTCHGEGEVHGNITMVCPSCSGTGFEPDDPYYGICQLCDAELEYDETIKMLCHLCDPKHGLTPGGEIQ